MQRVKLTKEEKEILKAVEKGEYISVDNKDDLLEKFSRAASLKLRKESRITIRISEHDLARLKKKAKETGIPYQTLIGSLLHLFAEGKLKITI